MAISLKSIPSQPTENTAESVNAPATTQSVTWRAWAIGALLIPLLVFWVEYTEIVASGPDLAAMSLPMASTFALLVLIAINLVTKKLAPKLCLNQADLIVIYTMNTIAVYISGIGMMQFLTPTLVGWFYFMKPENRWDQWFPMVRDWAVPDRAVIADYYAGRSSLFTPDHLAGWAHAIAIWSVFIFVLVFSLYCVATVFRKQWVEAEHLAFPIVQIPVEITRAGGDTPLWQNKLLWGGVAIAAILETIATIHFTMAPAMPYLAIKPEKSLEIQQYITTPPWNAIGYTTLSFYPLVIGLTYLLSLEISFSCWFFFLFSKLEAVMCTAFGFRDPGAGPALAQMPYINEQGFGAFIGLALYSGWLGRSHIKAVVRKAFGKKSDLDDSNEPMSFRLAIFGFAISAVFLVGFGVALGLSPVVACLFFGIYFLLALAFTRIRAEAGLPWGQGPNGLAHGAMISYAGTEAFGRQELVGLTFIQWFDSDWRCLPQTIQAESMKMADAEKGRPLNQRQLTLAMLSAVVIGTIAAWVSCLEIYYHFGASSAIVNTWRTQLGQYPFTDLQNHLTTPMPMNASRIAGAGVGLAVCVLMSWLRTRFLWWPFHPIGFAVGYTSTMSWIWFSVLIGWAVKTVLLRFGGSNIYRQALPFFIGLVLGDYAISGLWSLYFLASGHPGYRTFPI